MPQNIPPLSQLSSAHLFVLFVLSCSSTGHNLDPDKAEPHFASPQVCVKVTISLFTKTECSTLLENFFSSGNWTVVEISPFYF